MITRKDVLDVMAETVAERMLSVGCNRIPPLFEREQENDEDDYVIKALMRWHDRAYKIPGKAVEPYHPIETLKGWGQKYGD